MGKCCHEFRYLVGVGFSSSCVFESHMLTVSGFKSFRSKEIWLDACAALLRLSLAHIVYVSGRMGIGEVFDLLPHLRDLERVNVATYHVVPLDAPKSEVTSTLLLVSGFPESASLRLLNGATFVRSADLNDKPAFAWTGSDSVYLLCFIPSLHQHLGGTWRIGLDSDMRHSEPNAIAYGVVDAQGPSHPSQVSGGWEVLDTQTRQFVKVAEVQCLRRRRARRRNGGARVRRPSCSQSPSPRDASALPSASGGRGRRMEELAAILHRAHLLQQIVQVPAEPHQLTLLSAPAK